VAREHLVSQGLLAHQALLAKLVLLEDQGPLDPLDRLGLQDPMELLDPKVRMDLPDPLEFLEALEQQASRVDQVPQGAVGTMEHQGHPDLMGLLEPLDPLEMWVYLVQLVLWAHQDQLGLQDNPDLLVLQDHQDPLVLRVQRDPMDNPEVLDLLDSPDLMAPQEVLEVPVQ